MNADTLYDACVSPPLSVVRFLRAAHGGKPRHLRVDFSITPTLSNTWDAAVGPPVRKPARVDVIAALGFSLGNLHTRTRLCAWMRSARSALAPGGVVVADLYGGTHALLTGLNVRTVELEDGTPVDFTFEQRAANPVTSMVVNALHFSWVPTGKKRTVHLRDAHVFHWRLWSPAELANAFAEAGFSDVTFHHGLPGPRPRLKALRADDVLPDNWVLHVVARR